MVRNLNSSNLSLRRNPRQKEQRVNGPEWFMLQKAYNAVLINFYKLKGLAGRGIRFLDYLKTPDAKLQIEYIGAPFRPISITLNAYRDALPQEDMPWINPATKLMLPALQGTDPHLADRIIDMVVSAMLKPGQDPLKYTVSLYDTKNKRILTGASSSVIFGQLITTMPYQLSAIVRELPDDKTRTKPSAFVLAKPRPRLSIIETPIGKSLSGGGAGGRGHSGPRGSKQVSSQRARSHTRYETVAPPRDTNYKHAAGPLSKSDRTINDAISDNLTRVVQLRMQAAGAGMSSSAKRQKMDKLLKDQMLVAQAVQETIMDDKTYSHPDLAAKKTGTGAARAYWKERGVNNIADLCNTMTHTISAQISSSVEAKHLLKKDSSAQPIESALDGASSQKKGIPEEAAALRRVMNATAAKEKFGNAMIECGIWERLKHASGYYGTDDDGGPCAGPSPGFRNPMKHHCAGRFASLSHPDEANLTADVVLHHRHLHYEDTHILDEQPCVQVADPKKFADCVVVLRPAFHHAVVAVKDRQYRKSGSESDSASEESDGGSGDELAAMLNRGARRKLNLEEHTADSVSASESSGDSASDSSGASDNEGPIARFYMKNPGAPALNHKSHSNFLEVLRRAYPNWTALQNVSLVLALPNSVFNTKNFEKVVQAVKRGTRSYGDFVNNYVITGTGCCEICNRQHRALSGVVYSVDEKAMLKPRKECLQALLSAGVSLKLESAGSVCHGFPETVRFASMPLIHSNF